MEKISLEQWLDGKVDANSVKAAMRAFGLRWLLYHFYYTDWAVSEAYIMYGNEVSRRLSGGRTYEQYLEAVRNAEAKLLDAIYGAVKGEVSRRLGL